MKSFVNAVVGGAIGLVALYAVGRVAYRAGHDMAEMECRYENLRRQADALELGDTSPRKEEPASAPASAKKQSGLGLMLGVGRLLGKKDSVLGRLVRNPEAHRLEAFVDGEEIHINVKRRSA